MENSISKKCIGCYDTGIINKGTSVEEPCPICRPECNHDWQLGTNGYTCRKCLVRRGEECKHEWTEVDTGKCTFCKKQIKDVKTEYNWEETVKGLNAISEQYRTALIDFISNLLISQRSQLIKEIEGMKKEVFNKEEVGKSPTHATASNINHGYNQAIDDIITLLKT